MPSLQRLLRRSNLLAYPTPTWPVSLALAGLLFVGGCSNILEAYYVLELAH